MKGRMISPGKAKGKAIVSSEPIGFYGGIDAKTGIVIEKDHPLEGKCVTDKILVPAGIVNKETETIVATGVILAGIPCVDQIDIEKIKNGDSIALDAENGEVKITE